MNVAQLWLTGSKSDLTNMCRRLELYPDSSWCQGDKKRNGKVYEDNGVGICIADASTPMGLVGEIRSFIKRCFQSGISFKNTALKANLSIGYTVGDSVQFSACMDFTAQDLQHLAEFGASISVCAYPTSDEANE